MRPALLTGRTRYRTDTSVTTGKPVMVLQVQERLPEHKKGMEELLNAGWRDARPSDFFTVEVATQAWAA